MFGAIFDTADFDKQQQVSSVEIKLSGDKNMTILMHFFGSFNIFCHVLCSVVRALWLIDRLSPSSLTNRTDWLVLTLLFICPIREENNILIFDDP